MAAVLVDSADGVIEDQADLAVEEIALDLLEMAPAVEDPDARVVGHSNCMVLEVELQRFRRKVEVEGVREGGSTG